MITYETFTEYKAAKYPNRVKLELSDRVTTGNHTQKLFGKLFSNITSEIPLKVSELSDLTRQTLEAADRGEDLIECKDADDMFRQLGI